MNLRSILFALVICLSAASHVAQAVTCATSMTASNPDAAYTDNGDGTVTHVPTGLMWKRCSEGQSWTGNNCTGTASTSTWAQALTLGSTSSFAGQTDWRLPNIKELRSLVEECSVGPAINNTIFPATPSLFFWSSSPYAYYSLNALSVDFYYGYIYTRLKRSSYDDVSSVRLVRGGKSFAPLAPPGAPTGISATAGNASAQVSFTTPAYNGGAEITGYNATCTAGGQTTRTGTSSASPITVSGLTNGIAYTCSVTATNTVGTSPASGTVSVSPSSSSAAFNGACDATSHGQTLTSAPSGGLCMAGSASAVASGNTAYTWSCTGSGGGGTASCSATRNYVVTPSAFANGSITPNTAQNVAYNATPSFTVTPGAGYTASVGGTCGGSLVGNTYTTSAITGACTVSATFSQNNTYTDNHDGTVTDTRTGLTWMRCAMGQTWNDSTCTGTAGAYTYVQAKALTSAFAGHSDWRLPNIRELQMIVDRSRYNPAIDLATFPNTPGSIFWSGSPYASSSSSAWLVDFLYGRVYYQSQSYSSGVRLVRGGQSLTLLSDARQNADYTDNNDGTVTHKPTGLMWKKCSEGQAGAACTGAASTYNWDQAMALTGSFAGHSDWRLPTEDELLSLPDYTRINPAINTTLFPNTPSLGFWSGSHSVSHPSAWSIYFFNGYASFDGNLGNYYGVRRVRSGQSASQTISFGAVPTLVVGGTGTVSATASSGLAVIFTSTTPSVCTVSGSTVTSITAGICTIAANQAGNASYNAATQVTQNIAISTTSQTVVEFYNTNLDNYFITADSSEAAAIDNGMAGPGWSRTGNSFKSGGTTSVCRFYGSQSPGPNSHFYTVDPGECASLKQIQANTPATQKRWNFESLDFVSTPPINGTCTGGTIPVYRAYNNGFARGVDSNHRITGSQAAIQQVVARGWNNEGVVMCAPN